MTTATTTNRFAPVPTVRLKDADPPLPGVEATASKRTAPRAGIAESRAAASASRATQGRQTRRIQEQSTIPIGAHGRSMKVGAAPRLATAAPEKRKPPGGDPRGGLFRRGW